MLIGALIAAICFGFLCLFNNTDNIRFNETTRNLRGLIRVYAWTLITISSGALIGLLIQGS